DPAFHSRPRTDRRRRRCRPVLPQCAQPCPARRAARLSPLLDGRAPFDAGHRQRRHGGGARLCRRGDDQNPHRRGRHHASQPLAAAGRGAVRDPGVALSGSRRPWPWACAGHRSGYRPRDAPQPQLRPKPVPARRGRADGLSEARRARAAGPRHSGRGAAHPDLDPRLEPVRRATRGDAGTALRLRLPLRARADAGGDRGLSGELPALRAARRALCHARLQCLRGRDRRRGGQSCHVGAAGLRGAADRPANPAPAAAAGLSGKPAGLAARHARSCAGLLSDWLAGDRRRTGQGLCRGDGSGRADDHVADLRSPGPASLLRAARPSSHASAM
ncbi:MAG: Luciferase-like monooxygenase YhbW, partial [uncultured Sphingosinicella sp.]